MIDKNRIRGNPDSELVRHETTRLGLAVDAFAEAMKIKLEEKARDGWLGWDDTDFAEGIYSHMLARATAVPLAAGQEVDVANFAMMLWWTHD